uniref:Carnitine O-acetyltransferase-like n=1 Tax=Saccoglossus kowalevskii TaxID=10224 RepID=A0ABM0MEL7_SACKO|nr:PREDICTED: carnitine O-acetyltransferase-like [Saccoglossus kowalevskii]
MTAPMQISAKAPIMRSYSSHQSSLPKLPVPQFQKTLQKYLLAVQPLLTEEEFQHTKQIVEEFGKPGGQGEELQMKLVQRSQKYENWLSEWWLNAAYLDYRTPVVVHSSPGVAFPLMDFKSEKDQLSFAAKLICGALDYKDVIDREKIPIDMMGGHPLCMDQYYKLLSSCRIPGTKRDSIVVYPGNKSNAPRHIVVAHNNHFFELDVYHSDGKHLTMEELFNQLEKICSMSPQATDPVGILTTEHRNTWGKVYKKLKKLDKVNKKSLEKIEKAILLLCLDRPLTYDPDDRLSALGRQVLHGDGSHGNGGNRWVDKTIQV